MYKIFKIRDKGDSGDKLKKHHNKCKMKLKMHEIYHVIKIQRMAQA